MRKILIVNDSRDAGYPYKPFVQNLNKEIVSDPNILFLNPKRFCLVIFTGGEDVMPELYGDTSPNSYCYTNPKRDREEIKIFNIAKNNNIAMFGICRGLQLINIMSGGKLIHHLTGHQVIHQITTADAEFFDTNSLHHQACILPLDAEALAWSTEKLSSRYIGDEDQQFNYHGPEIESAYYPKFKAAGVQWHPEAMMSSSYLQKEKAVTWSYTLARDIINCSPDAIRRLYYINRPRVDYVEGN